MVGMTLSHPTVSLSALRSLEDRIERERLRFEDFATPAVDILDAQRTRIIIHDRDRLAGAAGERAGGTTPKSAASKTS